MTLIDDCRQFWKLWSVKLAALAGIVAAAITANPGLLLGLLAYIPAGWREVAAAGVGLAVFVVPTLVRLAQQPKLKGPSDGQ